MLERKKKCRYNQKTQKSLRLLFFFVCVSCMLSSHKNVPGIFLWLEQSAKKLGENIVKPLGNVADFASQTYKRKQRPLWARIIWLMAIKWE